QRRPADQRLVELGRPAERGVDDQVDLAPGDEIRGVGMPFVHLEDRPRGDPVSLEEARGALGGEQFEAEMLELLGQEDDRALVVVGYRDEGAALERQLL